MKHKERILIVEDEPSMRRALEDMLVRHAFRVVTAKDGAEGLQKAIKEKPDLILLDVMLPRLDGFALCSQLRKHELDLPILFLSARASVDDRVQGLDYGGDDYLSKPFSQAELFARIRALLRRGKGPENGLTSIQIGNAEVDFVRHSVSKKGKAISLSRKEFGMLRLMAQRQGAVVSRQDFLDLIWGYAAFPTTRTVDRHIVGLRQKFEPVPEKPQYILTAHGVGYRLHLESSSSNEN